MDKPVNTKNGLQIAYIQQTADPFRSSWMECSNCYHPLFERRHVPETIPTVCPRCLCILKANKIRIEEETS